MCRNTRGFLGIGLASKGAGHRMIGMAQDLGDDDRDIRVSHTAPFVLDPSHREHRQ